MNSVRLSIALAILGSIAGTGPASWTSPAPVAVTSQDSLDPRMAVDASGHASVVWRERTGGTTFKIWYTTNRSGSFAPPAEISHGGSVQGFSPVVCVDGDNVDVAWACDLSGNNWEIWYRRAVGGIWGTIHNASNTAIKSLRPAIAMRQGVGPFIAWDEALYADDNYDTFLSAWNGSGFDPAINLSNTPGGPVYGSVNVNLAVSPNGDVTAVWADRITGDYRVNARRRVGGVWQARQELSTLATGPSTPGIAPGADNRIHVVYVSGDLVRYQVWNGSAWTAPITLPGGLSGLVRPKVAVDADGFAHVVADAFTDAANNRDIFYCTNAGGSWLAWSNLSGTTATSSLNADIGFGGGGLTVTWQENSNGSGGTGVYNVWYTRRLLTPPGPTGSIAGFVRDPQGWPVPGATVAVSSFIQTSSQSNGAYLLSSVPVGTHTVTASKLYFTTATATGVVVNAGATTTLDFVIQTSPPDPVATLSVTGGNTINTLSWLTPTSGNFTGTRIRSKTTGFPSDPEDGTLVVDMPGTPSTYQSFIHSGLANGTTYYYAAWSYFGETVRYYATTPATAVGRPAGPCDFNRDGDVDLDDFAVFQACLSGSAVPQTDPACAGARLDADNDVDQNDRALFMGCVSGAGLPANPACLPP